MVTDEVLQIANSTHETDDNGIDADATADKAALSANDDVIADVQTPRQVLPRDVDASKKNALTAARLCESYRGEDVVVLDLTSITPEFDFFIIATAGSRRQMHAIVDEVDRALEHGGHKRKSIEGYDNTAWIVQDYGDIVLHVFLPDARELYDLENLWGDAPRLAWQAIAAD